MNRIANLRRLYWDNRRENYMFDGCLASVMAALGEDRFDFDFFAAVSGDFFTQMFDPDRPVDSLSQDFFAPELARNAFSACGYACEVLTGAEIAAAPEAALARVRERVDRGVPAIVRGISSSEAFSLIGGCDGNGLLINAWDNQDPADPYVRIETGLAGADVLILAGEKAGEPALGEVWRTVLDSIPKHLTHAPRGSCRFGKQAFAAWAVALLDDANFADDDEAVAAARAVLHDAPLTQLTTNVNGVRRVLGRINRDHPELGIVRALSPAYAEIMSHAAELVRLQDGFFVPPEKLRDPALRAKIAGQLDKIRACQDDIYAVFCE